MAAVTIKHFGYCIAEFGYPQLAQELFRKSIRCQILKV
jgi:hypothetical protein